MSRRAHKRILAAVLGMAAAVCFAASADDVSLRAAVEKQDPFVGESFLFQIQVDGSDHAEEPDLTTLEGFSIESLGGQQNSSQSVTIVNGKMTRVVQKAYVFSYRLTPTQEGRLVIPPITVAIDGKEYQTNPVPIAVRQPAETDDFKLRLSLSKERCYVGEPVILTATWYIGKDVRNCSFAVPALQDDRFFIRDMSGPRVSGKEYYQVPVNAVETQAEHGQGRLDGRDYVTLTFKMALAPKEAGIYDFPRATVASEVLTGRRRSRDPFDAFFSDNRGEYRTIVTPSNPLTLEVVPLPAEGRPAGFTGLVGQYRIETSAAPTEVNIGDPITLTIRIQGVPFADHVELPPLDTQPALARDFKIPKEMAPPAMDLGAKVYTQTIRALHSGVAEVPSIELSYFDPETGTYRVASSGAIPLEVHDTRVVTADDAEGREAPVVRSKLTVWREGIAHNYDGSGVLTNQAYGPGTVFRSPLWAGLVTVPPLGYGALALAILLRRRGDRSQDVRKARGAYRVLAQRLHALRKQAAADEDQAYAGLLDALRTYFADRLGMPAGATTYDDLQDRLAHEGLEGRILSELKALFELCEAHRYTGGQTAETDARAAIEQALALAETMERALR